jgi:hypothetical protein
LRRIYLLFTAQSRIFSAYYAVKIANIHRKLAAKNAPRPEPKTGSASPAGRTTKFAVNRRRRARSKGAVKKAAKKVGTNRTKVERRLAR